VIERGRRHWRDGRERRGFALQDGRDEGRLALALERLAPRGHFVEHAAQGEDVAARVYDPDLSGASFHQSNLVGTNFNAAGLVGAKFVDVKLIDVKIIVTDLRKTIFENCIFEGVDFDKSDLRGVCLDRQTFVSVKFDNSVLKEVTFRGATLKNVSFRATHALTNKFYRTIKTIRFDDAMMDKLSYNSLKGMGADLSQVTIII
jgi:uncharacterized protein YjbI with pentapeptide repeats